MSRNGPQLAFRVHSHLKFIAEGPGGLRLDLMHNLTDFHYYISIVILEDEVVLRYAIRTVSDGYFTKTTTCNLDNRIRTNKIGQKRNTKTQSKLTNM